MTVQMNRWRTLAPASLVLLLLSGGAWAQTPTCSGASVPNWTVTARPTAPPFGTLGYNLTTGYCETYTGAGWLPQGSVATGYFGSGADGAVTIASGTTTLTRPMFYQSLTLSGTGKLAVANFPVFVLGTCDITQAGASAINADGAGVFSSASGSTGGATNNDGSNYTLPPRFLNGSTPGAGGNGSTSAGSNAGNSGGQTEPGNGGSGGVGGAGGAAGANAGGTGATAQTNSNAVSPLYLPSPDAALVYYTRNTGLNVIYPGMYAGGGGGGAGDGTNAGGGGGASGEPGGHLDLACGALNRGPSTAASAISARPGASGPGASASAGNAAGGGGAGGAGGGVVYLFLGQLLGSTATNAVDVSGGAGANGGNGLGTGNGGLAGTGGYSGSYQIHVFSTGTLTSSGFNTVAGSAPTAPSGTTGGIGGTGGALKVNL